MAMEVECFTESKILGFYGFFVFILRYVSGNLGYRITSFVAGDFTHFPLSFSIFMVYSALLTEHKI